MVMKKIRPKKSIERIRPYVPGKGISEIAKRFGFKEDEVIKLASNENPYGTSPEVIQRIRENAQNVHLYPEPSDVSTLLSEYVGVEEECIITTPGMDGLIDYTLRAYVSEGDTVLITSPTFSYYEIASLASGGDAVHVFRREFEVDASDIMDNLDRCKLIFICSPNNPTGNTTPFEVIREIAESFDGIVFVDEAYVEFSGRDMISSARALPKKALSLENVIVGRTMSKAFGLAGLRIGYGILHPMIMEDVKRVATPFSVSSIAQVAAKTALENIEYFSRIVARMKNTRELLYEAPFKTYRSEANFVLMDVSPLTSEEVFNKLLERGVIVRDCSSFYGMGDHYIRVSVGREEETRRALDIFNELFR
jgi:histidinol-phosphate aminotransferase